ncbi:transposable element Tcb1 transposase [Trichonephila clavipes]|nr:transposable element Tcb1 transposase [Trichonephila clavipes]
MNCHTAYQTLPWPARSPDLSSIEHVWDMMGRRLHLPGNVDDITQCLEQIWQEIPQETIRVLYHSMPRLAAACIQSRYFVNVSTPVTFADNSF